MLARVRVLATHRDDHALLLLPVLALLIGVHVKTLRAAARDGRLPVIYDTKATFPRLRARATPTADRTKAGASAPATRPRQRLRIPQAACNAQRRPGHQPRRHHVEPRQPE